MSQRRVARSWLLLASAPWILMAWQVSAAGSPAVEPVWAPIGPFGVLQNNGDVYAGQVNAIAVHPADANLVFAGASEGGVWKSTDGGKSWVAIADEKLVRDLPSGGRKGTLAIGALALIGGAKGEPYTIYAGTGNPNVGCCSNNTGPGLGVFSSHDGGETWAPLGADLSRLHDRSMSQAVVYRLLALAGIHPLVFAATDRGLYLSIPSGVSDGWSKLDKLPPGAVSDLAFAGDCLFAGVWGQGVYRSCDLGHSFEHLGKGLPPPEERIDAGGGTFSTVRIGRIALAASGNVLYAGYESPVESAAFLVDTTYRLYRSDDGGGTWEALPVPPRQGQLDFNNALAVSPRGADMVYVGQVALVRALDGGLSGSWTNLSCCQGDGNLHRSGIDLHADLHAIVFAQPGSFEDDSSLAEVVYVATDGGVARGEINDAGGVHWKASSEGLAIGQCGTIDISGASALSAACGLWHNGNARTSDGKEWVQVGGGDGYQVSLDAGDPTTSYFNCNALGGGSICRGRVDPKHAFPISFEDQIWADNNNAAHWSDPFNPGHLLRLQGGEIFRTTSADSAPAGDLRKPESWLKVEPPGKAGATTTVAFAPPGSGPRYYLGTDAGDVWFGSPESGWQKVCGCGERVRSIAVAGPGGPLEAFVLVGADGTRGQVRRLTAPTAGPWSNLRIDQDFAPEVELTILNVVAEPVALPAVIYLGTTQGVYAGEEQGSLDEWAWSRTRGMPHVVVTDLVAHAGPGGSEGTLLAGTFGRGVFDRLFLTHSGTPEARTAEPEAPAQIAAGTFVVTAVAAGEDGALSDPGALIDVFVGGGTEERRTPFELDLSGGGSATLRAASEVAGRGETLGFLQWRLPDGSFDPEPEIALSADQSGHAIAIYKRKLERRIGSGRLAAFVDGSAATLDPSGFEVRVAWLVTGGEPPIAVRVEVRSSDGKVQEARDLPLVGDRTFIVEGAPGTLAMVTLTASDAGGAVSRMGMVPVALPE